MTTRKHYTDSEKEYFLQTAETHGITKAMQTCGFPADYRTAKSWVDAAGVEPRSAAKDYLGTAARRLDRPEIVKAWMLKAESYLTKDLTPAEFAKMADSVNKLMQTLQLVLGDATSRSESKTNESAAVDAELIKLAEQFNRAPASQDGAEKDRSDAETPANRSPKGGA